ncbi:MAG: PQQ-binding-like beta-propeller repeat protein [Planctomycetes bacterium]|nr:PQQ-binding-like beta-propeller repeat protein [Planctomycetota bacterium]
MYKYLPLLVLLFGLAFLLPLHGEETLPEDLGTRQAGIDWPDFLGPGRAGKSPETGLITDWTSQPPRIVWQIELGTSYGSPAICRGRLVHFDRHGDNDRVTCRESETGRELWRVEHPSGYTDLLNYNNGPRCSPVIDGNRVYTFSAEGTLQCVRLEDGKRLWLVDTKKEFGVVQNFFGVGSTPIVWGDLLIANVGGSPPDGPTDIYSVQGQVDGNGTGVVAFDKMTGKVVWQATDELASYASLVTATIDRRPWCFVFARGGLIGLDPRNGEVDFHFPWRARLLESVNASSPVVVGRQVFISEAYGVGSALLDVQPGQHRVVWQDKPRSRERSLGLHWNTAVHHEGYLYGSSGRHRGPAELRCIELATGKVMWSESGLTRSSLLQVDGHFVCLSEGGMLRLLRVTPKQYELVDRLELQDDQGRPLLRYPAWAAPVLSHGLMYVRGQDRLVCLEVIAETAQ